MNVLAYATPQRRPPFLPTVLLWLWAIADIVCGTVLAFIGGIGVAAPDADTGGHDFRFVVPWMLGLMLVAWGIYTALLAVGLHRRKFGAAYRAYRAVRAVAFLWSAGFLIIAGICISSFVYRAWDMLTACLLWTAFPYLFIFGAILHTKFVLQEARNREMAPPPAA